MAQVAATAVTTHGINYIASGGRTLQLHDVTVDLVSQGAADNGIPVETCFNLTKILNVSTAYDDDDNTPHFLAVNRDAGEQEELVVVNPADMDATANATKTLRFSVLGY